MSITSEPWLHCGQCGENYLGVSGTAHVCQLALVSLARPVAKQVAEALQKAEANPTIEREEYEELRNLVDRWHKRDMAIIKCWRAEGKVPVLTWPDYGNMAEMLADERDAALCKCSRLEQENATLLRQLGEARAENKRLQL